MKKMFKAMTAGLVSLSLLSATTCVFAEEIDESAIAAIESEEKSETLVLSCEEAIELAYENNRQLDANDAAIKSAELALDVANEQTKEYKSMEKTVSKIPGASTAINISNGLEQAYLKHGYYVDAATVGYDLALMEKEKTKSTIAYDVTQKYYNVKLMEKLIKISETGLGIAEENAEIVKKNYELGYVSELEVKNAENAVESSRYALETNKRNLLIATESLKIALGTEQSDKVLVLTDEIVMPEIPEGVDEKIDNAMQTRYDVTALKKSMELKKEYFDITGIYMNGKTSAYHTAYSDYLSAEYTYDNSSKLIRLSLKNAYAAVLTAKDDVTTAENNLEIKNIEYESAKIKYEMGMITNLELTSIMAELDACKVQIENAKQTYLFKVLEFEYNLSIGI